MLPILLRKAQSNYANLQYFFNIYSQNRINELSKISETI